LGFGSIPNRRFLLLNIEIEVLQNNQINLNGREIHMKTSLVLGSYMNAHFLGMDRLPTEGDSLAAHSVHSEHGGKGLNLGVGLHRLGYPVSLLLAVGNDEMGNIITRWLEDEGISTSLVLRLGERSGFGVGFIGPMGENFLAAFSGANALLAPPHVESLQNEYAKASWVCAQFEVSDAVILRAFQLARGAGCKTYLNPSPWRVPDREMLALTDVLVVNENEATDLFQLKNETVLSPTQWQQALPELTRSIDFNGFLLIVTLGENGCVAINNARQVWLQHAWQIKQADATGAGDAFGCGLLMALMQDKPINEALGIAAACGAIVASHTGVLDALPTKIQLTDFLADARGVQQDIATNSV
jgi:ribokinase